MKLLILLVIVFYDFNVEGGSNDMATIQRLRQEVSSSRKQLAEEVRRHNESEVICNRRVQTQNANCDIRLKYIDFMARNRCREEMVTLRLPLEGQLIALKQVLRFEKQHYTVATAAMNNCQENISNEADALKTQGLRSVLDTLKELLVSSESDNCSKTLDNCRSNSASCELETMYLRKASGQGHEDTNQLQLNSKKLYSELDQCNSDLDSCNRGRGSCLRNSSEILRQLSRFNKQLGTQKKQTQCDNELKSCRDSLLADKNNHSAEEKKLVEKESNRELALKDLQAQNDDCTADVLRKNSVTTPLITTTTDTLSPDLRRKVKEENLVHLGNSLYYFSGEENKPSWALNAETKCRSKGMELTSIETPEEQNLIYQYLRSRYNTLSRLRPYYAVIIGGIRRVGFNIPWAWVGTKQQMKYTNWDHGHPLNDGNRLQRPMCMSLNANSGKWRATPCTTGYFYLCELQIF